MQYVPNIKPKSLAFVTTNKCTAACHNCCFNCSPKNNKRLKLKNILAIIGQVVEDFPSVESLSSQKENVLCLKKTSLSF